MNCALENGYNGKFYGCILSQVFYFYFIFMNPHPKIPLLILEREEGGGEEERERDVREKHCSVASHMRRDQGSNL